MMSEAVSRLIDTLNGQFKELPALAKTMVEQWTVSHYVMFGLYLLAAGLLAFESLYMMKAAVQKSGKMRGKLTDGNFHYDSEWNGIGVSDQWQLYVAIPLALLSISLLAFSLGDLYKALNPIVTLINNFR